MSGADEIQGLARDLGRASAEVAGALYDVYAEQGDAFADDWADNVREVAPTHLPHLPAAITAETRLSLGIVVEVGAEKGRRQAEMSRGDEFGSRNQRPHLSGLRAMTARERLLGRAADTVVTYLMP